jgi:PhnB protein
MAKTVKKKKKAQAKPARKIARVVAKSRSPKRAAKPASKKTSKIARPPARKAAPRKIDPLNRKQLTSITPMLAVRDIRQSVEFYTTALGFTVRNLMDGPEGPQHAELRLRDTTLMLSPESREQNSLSANSIGGTPATLYVLVEDVDDVFSRAVAAGAKVMMPLTDMFWGDRVSMVTDPDGNKWMIATHKAEPSEADMRAAMQRQMAEMAERQSNRASVAAAGESEY